MRKSFGSEQNTLFSEEVIPLITLNKLLFFKDSFSSDWKWLYFRV